MRSKSTRCFFPVFETLVVLCISHASVASSLLIQLFPPLSDTGAKQHHQDSGYDDHMLKKYSDHGQHDKYGGAHSSHGSKHGNGLYTRDRGYGYEKHYAYDKELATKAYGADHSDRAHHYGDHGKHSTESLVDHGSSGHRSAGSAAKYGGSGHRRHSHAAGAYGDHHAKHGANAHSAYQPYTEYSAEPAYAAEYAPSYPSSGYSAPSTYRSAYVPTYSASSAPVYPAYKPAAATYHAAPQYHESRPAYPAHSSYPVAGVAYY
jgi:hypothetical protein